MQKQVHNNYNNYVHVIIIFLSGAHVVAPSDMMDGRVLAIKKGLAEAGLSEKVSKYIDNSNYNIIVCFRLQ